MKNYLLAAMLLMTSIAIAQRERTQSFGQQNMEELKMKVYQKDSLAPALVLFEQANYYLDEFNNFDFEASSNVEQRLHNDKVLTFEASSSNCLARQQPFSLLIPPTFRFVNGRLILTTI